jgi:hypothetical protein
MKGKKGVTEDRPRIFRLHALPVMKEKTTDNQTI